MAKTDVVRHDLTASLKSAAALDLNLNLEPIPFPTGRSRPKALEKLLVKPPVVALVSDEDRVKTPYRSVGKVDVISDEDKPLYGSGWVLAKKAFATAAHGVYGVGKGGWVKKISFSPRFNVTADKTYEVSTIFTLKGWVDDFDWPYDMAVCVVTENFAETEPPIKYQDGIFPPSNFLAIGYPKRPVKDHAFNGLRMWQCVGEFIKDHEEMWWAANDFTSGSSGGPWCDAEFPSTVYGLTSKRDEDPEVAYSPILLNGFENLYNTVKNL